MPRDVASSLAEKLLQALPATTAYAPADLDRSPIPKPVTHYLKCRLRQVISEQCTAPDHAGWTNHAHPDVQRAKQAYQRSLAQHAQFPSAAWEKELTQAVHRTTHYLVRPVRTAIRFIFVDDEPTSLPADVVLERLRFFSAYSYLQEAVKAYIEQREVESVDRTRLATLLTRVDQQMTSDYSDDQWLHLTEPLFDMSQAAFDQARVPADMLQQFFEDKAQDAIADRLEDAPAMIDRHSLRALLRDDAPAQQDAHTHQDTHTQQDAPAQQRTTNGASPEPRHQQLDPTPVKPPQSDDEPVPLWKQFQQQSSPSVAKAVSSDQTSDNDNRPRWEKFQPAPNEPSATAPLEELETKVLGPRGSVNRQRFIRQLFSGSEDEYRQVLGRLREVNSWNEASQIIAREVFRKHQVNIYSDPAVSFTNAVEATFRDE